MAATRGIAALTRLSHVRNCKYTRAVLKLHYYGSRPVYTSRVLSYVWLLSCCNNCIKCSMCTVHMLEVAKQQVCTGVSYMLHVHCRGL